MSSVVVKIGQTVPVETVNKVFSVKNCDLRLGDALIFNQVNAESSHINGCSILLLIFLYRRNVEPYEAEISVKKRP